MENNKAEFSVATAVKTLQKQINGKPHDPSPPETLFEVVRMLEETDLASAHKLNGEVRKASAAGVRIAKDFHELDRFYRLHKKALLFDARQDFDAYLQFLELDREPQHRFYLSRRRVLAPLVRQMEALCTGELSLLTVSMPPGTGKSALGIFFLSWVMGRFPNRPNLASGHSSFLTRSLYDGVLAVISDRQQYLWAEVFPELQKTVTSARDTSIHLGSSNRYKTLTTRSIEASLTGVARCEGLLYADDLVDGIESALSRERMDRLWQLYTDNLRSRKKEGCAELHVATRWSVHDPIGRLETLYAQDPKARFLCVPALDEQGESAFDYRYGTGFSTKYFLDMRAMMDEASFQALFMNQPVERQGLLFQEEELRRFRQLPAGEPDAVVAVCDTACGGGDDTFLPVGYLYGKDCYIVDCVCDDGLPEVTDALCAALLVRLRVQQCRFESNAAGGRTADKVRQLVQEQNGTTHISKRYTTANKQTKILVHSSYVKEHFLFLEKGLYQRATPYEKMLRKLCSYTMTGSNRQDDVPDGMAQLAELLLSLTGGGLAVAALRHR